MPKISVVIATRNRYESLKDIMESLVNQERHTSFDYEIIVVDNGSVDRTKEVIESYIPKFNKRLRYLFEPASGKAHALNRSIKEVKGTIVAFTDDDVILEKDWLLKISEAFSDPKVGLLQGRVLPLFKRTPPMWYDVDMWYGIRRCFEKHDGNGIRKTAKEETGLDGASFAILKKNIDIIGEFNVNIIRGEDTEYGIRAIQKGIDIYYGYEVKAHHKVDDNKLDKNHYRKIAWRSGRDASKIEGMFTVKTLIFGIPRWLYRSLLEAIAGFILNNIVLNQKKGFRYEKRTIYLAGLMCGFRQRYKNKIGVAQ